MDQFAHIFCAAALAAVPGACSAVTTQITIGEINLHTGWLDSHQSLTWRQSKRNR